MTTRTVKGVVAGGDCKKSIIPTGTVCKVKIRSEDGCYEKTQQIEPWRRVRIDRPAAERDDRWRSSVHSDPTIKTAFQVQGGATGGFGQARHHRQLHLLRPASHRDASGFDPTPPCTQVVFDQGEAVTINIRLAEDYYGDRCYVDSAAFRILNGLAGELVDTTMGGGVLKYKFKVGNPNPAAPFLQTLQIIATTLKGDEVSLVKQALVTGLRSKEQTFTTILPETPWLVLRDPPGDGSYAYWEKVCGVNKSIDRGIKRTTRRLEQNSTLGPDFGNIFPSSEQAKHTVGGK
ncbi:MAG: hypothetical protein IPM98_15855 [Lewinellaceae bacterium]|nr:hypothetical protein [Lewinellaceae bacterium]